MHLGRTKSGLLAAVGLTLLLSAGCGSSDKTDSSGGGDAPIAREPAAGAPNEAGKAEGDQSQAGGQAPALGRAIVYTGQITVRVERVPATAEQVRTLATSVGGFVGSEKSTSDGSRDQSTITVRVPAKEFDSVLNQLGKLGKELDRSATTEDVTTTVVDLEARIAAQRASVDSVRRMFAQAKQLNEVVLLEKELTQRQAELDALLAKQRRLDDLVALSTVTVNLVGPDTPYASPEPSFVDGLKAGWQAFLFILKVAAVAIGFLLPFLLVAALVGVPLLWWLRRGRRIRRRPPD